MKFYENITKEKALEALEELDSTFNIYQFYRATVDKEYSAGELQFKSEILFNIIQNMYGYTKEDFLSKYRGKEFIRVKHVMSYLLYDMGYSFSSVAKVFNNTHATVIHSKKKVEYALCGYDKPLQKAFTRINNELQNQVRNREGSIQDNTGT